MKNVSLPILGALTALLLAASQPALRADPPADAAYRRVIDRRTDSIVAVLHLADPAVRSRVHAVIADQYYALNAWQAAHETSLKHLQRERNNPAARADIAEIMATRQALHRRFLAALAADLTPAQIDQVKDKMTYDKLEVTYGAYCEIIPHLTATQKSAILAFLDEAREQAMDGVSAKEKSDIFNRYKGKINNYLSHEGVDVGAAYKAWGRRQKTRAGERG